MEQNFITAELQARKITDRFFCKHLAPKLSQQFNSIFAYKHTPVAMNSPFDSVFTITEPLTNRIQVRAFVEVKIRQEHYDSQIMERGKNNSLLKLLNQYNDGVPTKAYYLIFTPKKAYLFDVARQNSKELVWERQILVKNTAADNGEVEKAIVKWNNIDASSYSFSYRMHDENPLVFAKECQVKTLENFAIEGVYRELFEHKQSFELDK